VSHKKKHPALSIKHEERSMSLSRRRFLEQGAFGAAALAVLGLAPGASWAAALRRANVKVGATDWNLQQEGKIGAFTLGKESGVEGIQVSLGGRGVKGELERLPMCDPEKQKQWREESEKTGMPIGGTCLEILHQDNLKAHPNGPKWVEQSIEATKALGTKVILLPFFGKQQIKEKEEQKAVADRLKRLAPLAEKAGVVLGLENTISAEENASILDLVASPAVKVYYDVGNSFSQKYDIYKEVVWLGKDRICQLHLKDNPSYIGKGPIDFPRFIEGVLKSGFEGWAMLETSSPSKVIKDDMAANYTYVRGLLDRKK
jgi:sugar phosphate isomerase/epimerase